MGPSPDTVEEKPATPEQIVKRAPHLFKWCAGGVCPLQHMGPQADEVPATPEQIVARAPHLFKWCAGGVCPLQHMGPQAEE